jgi:hypothetical protein
MKTLRSISIAVLLSLAVAAPAAASTVSVSVSSPNTTLGTAVSYTISGEAEVTQTYEVRMISTSSANFASACENKSAGVTVYEKEVQVETPGVTTIAFAHSAELPLTDYSSLGTYAVCGVVRMGREPHVGTPSTSNVATFTVNAPVTPPVVPSSTPPAPAPVPLVAPAVVPATIHIAPVTNSAQKLHTALVKCRKQKNKKKRVKCERAAKTAAHR